MTATLNRSPSLAAAEWTALGCLVRLVVTDGALLDDARGLLAEDLEAIDRAASRFRPDSELTYVDAHAGRRISVSPLLADAVAAGVRAARLTGGDVDPTLGSELVAAGYDRDFSLLPPDGPAVRVVRHRPPAWQRIEVDPVGRTLRVPEGVRLDLGATAKAFVADRAAARIAGVLGCGALVSLGGDIAVAGRAPEAGWVVRVQDITDTLDAVPADGAVQTVTIGEGGLATSSTTARRWVRGGQVMHHILDPRSGTPVVSRWRTVSVSAATCLDANIASTAAIVRGETAVAWLQRIGLPARLVDTDGHIVTVGAWPEPGARP